jgi:predicted lipoprotein with Yx(FWY)xxD motif
MESIMNRLVILAVGAGAVAVVAAGCSSSSTSSSSASSQASGGAAIVKAASSPLGQILVDGSGRTLYLYTPDTGTTSTCTGSCASVWPPDTTTGKPQESGLNASLLGTTTRTDDHATQVTYDGHPLYYYSGDAKPGDVNGEGLMSIWYVLSPAGSAITSTPAPSASSSTSTSTNTSSGGGSGY